jgi:hypothetical protein
MKKLMRQSIAAAGFAALLLSGACAHTDSVAETTDPTDQVVEIRPEAAGMDASVAPAPGPAKVDSDGNVYASSAAPGRGNAGSVGTNTNVNIVPERSTVNVTGNVDPSPIAPDTTPVTDLSMTSSSTVDTSSSLNTTTTTVETTTVPMTSSVQESNTTTEEEGTPARTRMRKH